MKKEILVCGILDRSRIDQNSENQILRDICSSLGEDVVFKYITGE